MATSSESFAHLTAFRRKLFLMVAYLDGPSGRDIQRGVWDTYGYRASSGLIYPNLERLVDKGLIVESSTAETENQYELTQAGEDCLLEYHEKESDTIGSIA